MQIIWKNNRTPQKRLVMQGLKEGKNFAALAADLNVAQATAEVYGIDCLAAGAELDHETIATFLDVTEESFSVIKREILSNEERKLRTIRDNLGEVITYNQIRFVIACLIHNLEI